MTSRRRLVKWIAGVGIALYAGLLVLLNWAVGHNGIIQSVSVGVLVLVVFGTIVTIRKDPKYRQ